MDDRLQRALGIEVPIVLGPFGGLSSVALVAAVSDHGGLGSYGLYGYGADQIAATAAQLRAATDRPFALNLWLPTGDEVTPDAVDLTAARGAVAGFFAEFGMPQPPLPERFLPDIHEQLDAVLAAAPAVLSIVFGVPDAALVEATHARGIRVVAGATTVAEAILLDAAGVDAIVASGAEAAGHRVSFLAEAEHSLVGLFALVPQVVDAVSVPVIAAGGVADRRGVAAAFALGASGVQVGTAFLHTRQSAASDGHRAAITSATDTTTVLTRALSGRLSRGIPNRAMRTIEAAAAADPAAVAPFPAQNWLTGRFRAEAGRRGMSDLQSLWAGQAAALSTRDDAAEVFAELARGIPA